MPIVGRDRRIAQRAERREMRTGGRVCQPCEDRRCRRHSDLRASTWRMDLPKNRSWNHLSHLGRPCKTELPTRFRTDFRTQSWSSPRRICSGPRAAVIWKWPPSVGLAACLKPRLQYAVAIASPRAVNGSPRLCIQYPFPCRKGPGMFACVSGIRSREV